MKRLSVLAVSLPLLAVGGTAMAALPASSAPLGAAAPAAAECAASVSLAQEGGTSWWEPIRIAVKGTFPNDCTVTPGSTIVLTPSVPAGLSFKPARYPFTGGTMDVSDKGVVTFTFDDTFSTTKTLGRYFGGTLLMDFSHVDFEPGDTVTVDWTGGVTATLPITLPECPSCSGFNPDNGKWSTVVSASPGQGYNDIWSGVVTKPIAEANTVVTLSDTLTGAQECVAAQLVEIRSRNARGVEDSRKLMDVPCNGTHAVGPVTVPAQDVTVGHIYQLLVHAKTTGYQAQGYYDEGSVTLGTTTEPVRAVATWTTGSAYGGGDVPPVSTASPTTSPTTSATTTSSGTPTSTPTETGTVAPTETGTVAPTETSTASPSIPTESGTVAPTSTATSDPTDSTTAPTASATTPPVAGGTSTTPPVAPGTTVAPTPAPGTSTTTPVADDTPGEELPYTGAAVGATVGLGALLAAGGAGLLVASRRRREGEH